MKFYIKTLGCKLNRYDSDQLAEQLILRGFEISADTNNVDLLVVNSCTVTNSADHKSRQAITHLKKQSPKAKVIVMGCGTKSNAEQFQKKEEVDFVSGNQEEILEYVNNSATLRLLKCDTSTKKSFDKLRMTQTNFERTRANIKVQNGCENYCSYCIIAFVRGDSESLPSHKIIKEIQKKEAEGFQEIVITGINIGAYGASLTTRPEENTLAELLEEILEKTSIPRIRLSSIGPQYFSNKLIKVLENTRICQHLHLSIQSCSNSVLKRMNRPYTIESVIKLAAKLRKVMPDIALTSDIITGFPEETDAEHQETLQKLEKVKLMKTHIFPYSVRNGTVAAKMQQVPQKKTMERKQDLAKANLKMRKDFIKDQIGKTKKVLFEFKNKQGYWQGYTDNYIRVRIKSEENLENQIREIQLSQKDIVL